MANEFKHKDIGTELTKAEWEATDAHEADSQAANDMLFYNSVTGHWERATPAQMMAKLSGQAGAAFSMNSQKITDLAAPTSDNDAVRKAYADLFTLLTTFNAHKSRHQDGGADEISLADLAGYPWSLFPFDRAAFHEQWKNLDGWTENKTGSAGYSLGLIKLLLQTGTTNSSRESLYTATAFSHPQYSLSDIAFRLQSFTALTNSEVRIYLAHYLATAAPLSDTEEHGGFKAINGAIYSTHCDGSNAEVVTDLSTSIAGQWADYGFRMKGTGSTIQFYLNNTLMATHNTNLPDDLWNYRIVLEIKNTEAADKQVRVHFVNATMI